VATFVTSRTTLDSLQRTQTVFYADYRFADVFVTLKRAPTSATRQITQIPGVADVQTRVSSAAKLDVAGFDEPVTGFMVSLPDDGRPALMRDFVPASATALAIIFDGWPAWMARMDGISWVGGRFSGPSAL